MMFRLVAFAWALSFSEGFTPAPLSPRPTAVNSLYSSPLFRSQRQVFRANLDEVEDEASPSTLRRFLNRLDTLESAGIEDAKLAGLGSKIKQLHNPVTYLGLSLLAGVRWTWCFRNPYYWFAVAFCVKWYRARYVFKIPVWDRQPNWNNIITSKEQEKDLKAFTCKNCGSTLFIAKTREFFFEGNTGIGGLGCFSCGVKGKENFVMDRERIIEDVADEDDYFEYERPLDFVSRAERRNLLKEAGGDEEKANALLSTKSGDETGTEEPPTGEAAVNGDSAESASSEEAGVIDVTPEKEEIVEQKPAPAEPIKSESSNNEEKPKEKKTKKSAPKKAKKPTPEPPSDDDLDLLDMDEF